MRKENGNRSAVGTPGGSALMVIFAVLCLTVFAVLALSTMLADGRLSDNGARSTQEYYNAEAQAQVVLARLRSGEVPEGVTEEDFGVYSYSFPLSDSRSLQVRVAVTGAEYEILQWQAVYTGDWSGEETLNLWDGQ